MTPHPQRCDCLSAVGMSVECLDSYSPSHHKCDHVIKPSCWDIYNIATERDKVLVELRKIVVKLYDEGYKTPLATFDAAISLMKYGDTKLRTTPTPSAGDQP